MNTTNELKNTKAWKVRPLDATGGTILVNSLGLERLIEDHISHWPITQEEKSVLAFIAEKLWWKKGRYRESIQDIARRSIPKSAKRYTSKWHKLDQAAQSLVHDAMHSLEDRGFIKRTSLDANWEYMDDDESIDYCFTGRYKYEILNDSLRNLIANR
jgi:hypothetical protein